MLYLVLLSALVTLGLGLPTSDGPLWSLDSPPEPIRGEYGASVLGPHNVPLERENPDQLAPPSSDAGHVANIKWPFSLSHNRLFKGGWARVQNVNSLPVATELAGVNMRLKPGAVRELHWHTSAEWAYVLAGDVRITTVTSEGTAYVADVTKGDLWYFPAGIPHSLQAMNTTKDGAEFILVFDSGSFSDDSTFLLSDWILHTPKDVLAKNFGIAKNDISTAFAHIPKESLFIFPATPPPSNVTSDQVVPNDTKYPYTFPLSKVAAVERPGGSVKVVDQSTFKIADKISAVEVSVNPGGLRELHWHPTEPEWTFFIKGEGGVTVFAGSSNARTFNFQPGDVAYIPPSFGHYVENTGNTTLLFLEIFKSSRVEDISLTQWLALTPKKLVKANLGISSKVINSLSHEKLLVV